MRDERTVGEALTRLTRRAQTSEAGAHFLALALQGREPRLAEVVVDVALSRPEILSGVFWLPLLRRFPSRTCTFCNAWSVASRIPWCCTPFPYRNWR